VIQAAASESQSQSQMLAAVVAGADLVVNTTPVGMASVVDPAAAQRCPLSPGSWQPCSPTPSCMT
jgi:shikimate 5-dehydrogenase